jgi:ABC-type uncharacterized transport system substrate-binding protein
VKRRKFITLLGSAAATWPLAAHGQQPGKVPRIGFVGAASASSYASQLEGFRLGLRDLGYVEGTNIVVEYRWAQGRYERLRELMVELVGSNVDLIVTHGTPAYRQTDDGNDSYCRGATRRSGRVGNCCKSRAAR